MAAVKVGNLKFWPRLTLANVASYCLEHAKPTFLSHVTQVQQGLRLTHPPAQQLRPLAPHTIGAIPASNELHCFEVALSTLYTDDFECFPIQALRGNQHIMIAYHVGANAILVQPFQTKHNSQCIPTYNAIMTRLQAREIVFESQVLNNKANTAYWQAITNFLKVQVSVGATGYASMQRS